MKKRLISIILPVLLTLVLLRAFVEPQSVAVNFIAACALFQSLIFVMATVCGVGAYELWLKQGAEKGVKDARNMQILRVVFTKPVKPLRRFWSWMFFAFTFNVLIVSGWVFTGVLYLICGLMFKVVREHYRQRLDEDGLCPESL